MLGIIQMKMKQNENGTQIFRNAPDNEELSSPSFIMSPWLLKKTSIQDDPSGKQCYAWGDSDKRPTPIPSFLRKGMGGEQHLP